MSLADKNFSDAAKNDIKGKKERKACSRHMKNTRERYVTTLEALGCICRALLALGQQSCCAPQTQEPSSVERKSCRKKSSRTPSLKLIDRASTCTSTGSTCCKLKVQKRHRPKSIDSCCNETSDALSISSCKMGCCGSPVTPSGKGDNTKVQDASTCTDACCSGDQPQNIKGNIKEIINNVSDTLDIEKGLSGSEHIIISVSGMTCTGCETKLKRTLSSLEYIRNLRTSLVLARAEFDIDVGSGSAADVLRHLQRTTEFNCEKINSQGVTINVIPAGDIQQFLKQDLPTGVSSMDAVGRNTFRITYDAKIIGARDLVDHGFEQPLQLAPITADQSLAAGSKHVRHVGYMTLISAILTLPVLVLAWAPLPDHPVPFGAASLALATLIQVFIAGPFYPNALKALLFSRMIEMDLLIVLSTSAAYIFSVVSFGYLVSGRPLSSGEFFETSTLLVTLIMVGRYVSALARQKAVESISIRSLQTPTALIVKDGDNAEVEIDARLLQYGDIFKVVPESRVPTDGTVISGSTETDESMITGESRPIEKSLGDTIIAGSINGSGTVLVRLTRLPGDNTISTIASMVDEAKLSKPKIQDLADRIASWFVPVVVGLTIITFTSWVGVGVSMHRLSGSAAAIQAITYAITVLIVSCPCAIGLAVPMVVVIASGVAAERGVIFKSADSIEVAHKTTHVVFDKTGTLTEGKLMVVSEDFQADLEGQSRASELLLGLIGSIKHPVSAAVSQHLKAQATMPQTIKDIKTLPGKGVEGTTDRGLQLRAGNSRWLRLGTDPRVQAVIAKGYTTFCFTINDQLSAVFGLEDSIRPDALSTISKFQFRGIEVCILSGDDDGAVRSVATHLCIPSSNVRSRCSPGDKQAFVKDLLLPASNNPAKTAKPVVIFVGDGTNDSPALAQATIGIHMPSATTTDMAQSAADVVLVRPSLASVLTAIDVSKAAVNRIRFNFGWSFVYNTFAILLGGGAFSMIGNGSVVRIPPEYAGLGEIVSVLPVVVAAVLLKWSKI